MKKTLFLASLLAVAFSATQAFAGNAMTVTQTTHTLTAEQLTSGFSNADVTYTYDEATKLGILTGKSYVDYDNVHFTVSDSALTNTTTETNMIYVYTGTNSYGISVVDGGTIRGAWGQKKAVPSTWGSDGKAHSEYAAYVSDGSLSLKATFNKDNGTKLTAVADDKDDLVLYDVFGLKGGAATSLRINTDYVQTLDYNHYDFSYTDATGTHDIAGAAVNVISSTDVPATVIYKNRLEMNATGTANMSAHGGDIYVAAGGQAYVTGGTLSNNLFVGGSDHYVEGGNYDGDIRLEGSATISGTVTLLDDTVMASASNGGTFSGAVAGDGKKLTINKGHNDGTLNFTGTVTLGEMASANAVAFNNATGSFAVDKINNSNTTTVAAGTTLTIKELAGTGAVTNNGIINLDVNAESTTYVRTANGYNGTQKVITLGGTGALSGSGTWKVDGVNAALEERTLTALSLDESKYYVDTTDETYSNSLAGKYVVSADKKLTVSGAAANVRVNQNNGTLVADGMVGYFGQNANIGNLEIAAGGLTVNDAWSDTKTIANLSGTGTFKREDSKYSNETYKVTGEVSKDISIVLNRTASSADPDALLVTTFKFTKEGVDCVQLNNLTMDRGTLTLQANAIEAATATFNGGTLTVVNLTSSASETTFKTSGLTVTANSHLNADLVMNGGTLSFADNTTLTMGCSVEIGTEGAVTVVLTQDMVDAISIGGHVVLFTDVESATLGSGISFIPAQGTSLSDGGSYSLVYDEASKTIYVAPEPATTTLSLLALAGLMARRKRH